MAKDETYTAFFYGTLMAPPVLHRVLTGSPHPSPQLTSHLTIQPALLHGYQRHRVKHADYPAIIRAPSTSTVRGTLVTGLTAQDIWRLDIFEGSEYSRISVRVNPLILPSQPLHASEPGIGATSNGDDAGLTVIGDPSIDVDREISLGRIQLSSPVDAHVYVWTARKDRLDLGEWDFRGFVEEKMARWVGGKREERDDGFQDVDNAVASQQQQNAPQTDPTGGRGHNGRITQELEAGQATEEVIRAAV